MTVVGSIFFMFLFLLSSPNWNVLWFHCMHADWNILCPLLHACWLKHFVFFTSCMLTETFCVIYFMHADRKILCPLLHACWLKHFVSFTSCMLTETFSVLSSCMLTETFCVLYYMHADWNILCPLLHACLLKCFVFLTSCMLTEMFCVPYFMHADWNVLCSFLHACWLKCFVGTPTKRQVSKRQVFKTSGFKTSETSGLQNVSFTKRQVYKMSGLQNVRSSKHPVAKEHPFIFCTCGWWKSAGFCWSHASILEGFLPYITIISNNDTLITLNRNANLAIPMYTFCLIRI